MTRFRLPLAIVVIALGASACGQGNAFDMEVGECFQDPDSLEFSDVEKVDCGVPHDNEVFATYQLTSDSLPSSDSMQEGCVDRFAAAIGVDYLSSDYFVSMFGPTSEGWDELDDREVVCFVWLPGEQTTGSALALGA